MTEFNCDEHPHGKIWASSFVPKEIAAQGRVIVGSEMLAEAQHDLRGQNRRQHGGGNGPPNTLGTNESNPDMKILVAGDAGIHRQRHRRDSL